MSTEIKEIFYKITERYSEPVKIGSRCESNIFYRVEELTEGDLRSIVSYITERIQNVCSEATPQYVIEMPGNITDLATLIAQELSGFSPQDVEVITYEAVMLGNGTRAKLKGANVILVNEVITTARSCLEAHSRTSMMNASVNCWAALIDRTFGPGPVPIAAALSGEPVTLLG